MVEQSTAPPTWRLSLCVLLSFSAIASAQTVSISSISPEAGPATTPVTIRGQNFDSLTTWRYVLSQGYVRVLSPGVYVRIGSVSAPAAAVRYVSNTELVATVPAGATVGPVYIQREAYQYSPGGLDPLTTYLQLLAQSAQVFTPTTTLTVVNNTQYLVLQLVLSYASGDLTLVPWGDEIMNGGSSRNFEVPVGAYERKLTLGAQRYFDGMPIPAYVYPPVQGAYVPVRGELVAGQAATIRLNPLTVPWLMAGTWTTASISELPGFPRRILRVRIDALGGWVLESAWANAPEPRTFTALDQGVMVSPSWPTFASAVMWTPRVGMTPVQVWPTGIANQTPAIGSILWNSFEMRVPLFGSPTVRFQRQTTYPALP